MLSSTKRKLVGMGIIAMVIIIPIFLIYNSFFRLPSDRELINDYERNKDIFNRVCELLKNEEVFITKEDLGDYLENEDILKILNTLGYKTIHHRESGSVVFLKQNILGGLSKGIIFLVDEQEGSYIFDISTHIEGNYYIFYYDVLG